MNQERKNYIGYEYKQISVSEEQVSFYLDCYENFGWVTDDRRPLTKNLSTVTIYLKRDRKIVNKMELTRLQRNFEACIREIDVLEQSKTQVAVMWSLIVGIVGTAFMAGAVFAVIHEPPLYVLMVLFAIPAFIGWILPYFLYRHIRQVRREKVQPMIEEKREEIYQLCEKGHSLL